MAKLITPYVSNMQFVACQLNLNQAVKKRHVLGGGTRQAHSRGLINTSMFKRALKRAGEVGTPVEGREMNQMREESVGSVVPSSICWMSSVTAPPSNSSAPEGSSREPISRGCLVILILSLSAYCVLGAGRALGLR